MGAVPYWAAEDVTLYLGRCEDILPGLPANSVDAVVTDPPAAVSFMNKSWDSDRGGRAAWVGWLAGCMTEAGRVLKPGGHLLVWSLPRTSHWTAWALEDAGLEVRDCVLHLFGSGFPKSRDVSKAIDQEAGAERAPGVQYVAPDGKPRGVDLGIQGGRFAAGKSAYQPEKLVTAPATEEAARWSGFGTALKPGQEIWWLARKPLEGTVAGNVLRWGTGALNVDGCRVATSDSLGGGAMTGSTSHTDGWDRPWKNDPDALAAHAERVTANVAHAEALGRWPSNVVFTHSASCGGVCAADCPVAELDRQSGVSVSRKDAGPPYGACSGVHEGWRRESHANYLAKPDAGFNDSGGASRFYPVFRYQAKAPSSERPRLDDGSAHETVKPLGLMSWLVRLVTPPGGTVLDPFAGSGPTAEACIVEGFRCVLVEQDPRSAALIRKRLSKPIQPVMFGVDAI